MTSLADLIRRISTLSDGEMSDLRVLLRGGAPARAEWSEVVAAIREAFGDREAEASRNAALLKSIHGVLVDAGCSVGDADEFPDLVRGLAARASLAGKLAEDIRIYLYTQSSTEANAARERLVEALTAARAAGIGEVTP